VISPLEWGSIHSPTGNTWWWCKGTIWRALFIWLFPES